MWVASFIISIEFMNHHEPSWTIMNHCTSTLLWSKMVWNGQRHCRERCCFSALSLGKSHESPGSQFDQFDDGFPINFWNHLKSLKSSKNQRFQSRQILWIHMTFALKREFSGISRGRGCQLVFLILQQLRWPGKSFQRRSLVISKHVWRIWRNFGRGHDQKCHLYHVRIYNDI